MCSPGLPTADCLGDHADQDSVRPQAGLAKKLLEYIAKIYLYI